MAHRYKDPYSGKSKSMRHAHLRKEKRKLKHLIDIGGDHWYPWPVGWSDYDWDWNTMRGTPAEGAYIQRRWRGHRSKYLKTYGHRYARRNKKMNVYDSTYNKSFDFWWELD